MQTPKLKKLVLLCMILLILIISMTNIFLGHLPQEIRIIEGKEQKFPSKVPLTLQLFCEKPFFINGQCLEDKLTVNLNKPLALKSSVVGTYDLEFKWLGIISIKRLKVHVMPSVRVIPGGHSLGVKLRPNGVIVVGYAAVVDKNGLKHQPARDAGIKVGDTILMVNNIKIFQAEELSQIIVGKESVLVTVKRNGQIFDVNLNPVKNNFGFYQLGLWVRDVAAGVGTLTFYDPETGLYGALGHIISDTDTGKIIEVGEGEIIRAKVSSIFPGRKNHPGEKKGVFVNEEQIMGNIMANTPYGIFGRAYQSFDNPYYSLLPVATIDQIYEGAAKILTVLEGEEIREYEIEIQKIMKQSHPDGKGMVLKITDPELLTKTGGIIQGMSGSPIIQDGYIVGAVTHVFVNDPTKGYGIFIEWMLNELNNLNT